MGWLVIILAVVMAILILLGHNASRVQWDGKYFNWIDGLVRLLCKYVHHVPEINIPLPETGGAIVIANHVSGLDPFLLISVSRRPLRFLIAREEYERPLLNWLFKRAGCIPVDRSGKPELALRQALRALQDGEVIALFPHGKIHLDSDPPRKIKGGVARLAAWTQVPIFPVRIDGVGLEGSVAFAPFFPSHVHLSVAPSFTCQSDDIAGCLEHIANTIEKSDKKRLSSE